MLSFCLYLSSACTTFCQSQTDTEAGSLLGASGSGLRAHCEEKNGGRKVAGFWCFMLIMIWKLSLLMKEGIRIERCLPCELELEFLLTRIR